MDPQLWQVISDGGRGEGGLLTAKSGILKSGWIVVTVKMLSDPEKKAKKHLAEAEEYFYWQFKQFSVFFRDKI